MNFISITNCDTGRALAYRVQVAETMAERLQGLLGTSHLPYGHGLLLTPCYSIHTVGMAYAIDALFLDYEYYVLKIVHNLPPMQVASCRAGKMTLELPAGTAARTGTQVGHRLLATHAGYGEFLLSRQRR
jgi:uncharacterized membrane protein (UPF0127 family)